MSLYFKILLSIIIFPFLFSLIPFFRKKINYLALFLSIAATDVIFIFWDIMATKRIDWHFNPKYVSGIIFFGLPIEEILFFVAVPYACIFLYEGIKFIIIDIKFRPNNLFLLLLSTLSLFTACQNYDKNYTFTVFIFMAILFLLGIFLFKEIISSYIFYLWMGISTFLFFVFNYLLTSIPIVIYNPYAITNIRILTIPIEDFFYNFSMLFLYLFFYLKSKKIFSKGY